MSSCISYEPQTWSIRQELAFPGSFFGASAERNLQIYCLLRCDYIRGLTVLLRLWGHVLCNTIHLEIKFVYTHHNVDAHNVTFVILGAKSFSIVDGWSTDLNYSQWRHDVMITSLYCQHDVATSFWCNEVNIASHVRWVKMGRRQFCCSGMCNESKTGFSNYWTNSMP